MSRKRRPRIAGPHSDAAHAAITAYLVQRTLNTHGGADMDPAVKVACAIVLLPVLLCLLALALSALAQLRP